MNRKQESCQRTSSDLGLAAYSTDEHFALAQNDPIEAKENPIQQAAESGIELQRVNPAGNGAVRHAAKPEADGEGFEPPVPLRVRQFSRLLP